MCLLVAGKQIALSLAEREGGVYSLPLHEPNAQIYKHWLVFLADGGQLKNCEYNAQPILPMTVNQ